MGWAVGTAVGMANRMDSTPLPRSPGLPPIPCPAGVYDDAIVDAILATVAASSDVLRAAAKGDPSPGVIVMTGCGTSGRVAFLTARALNAVLLAAGLPRVFRYLVSGGDHALLLSDELPEVLRCCLLSFGSCRRPAVIGKLGVANPGLLTLWKALLVVEPLRWLALVF